MNVGTMSWTLFKETHSAFAGAGQDSWEWVRERRRARSWRRKLVGLARLSGDHTLVTVLNDVVVLPELQGRGLGRTLLRRLINVVGTWHK